MTTERGRTVQRTGRMARLLSYCAVVPVLCLFLLFSSVTVFGAGGDELMTYSDVQAGANMATGFTVDPNGDLIITGYRDTNVNDYYTVKFNGATGAVAAGWPNIYNSPSSNDDQAVAVIVDPNDSNSVIVTGFSWDSTNGDFDIYTVKYNSNGTFRWGQTFDAGFMRNEYPKAIAVDSNSNIYVAGRAREASGVYDYLIVKYDINGNQAAGNWPLMPAGCANCEDWILSIDAVFDGATDVIAVTGKSQNALGDYDSRTIKYQSDGTQLWQKVHAGTGAGDDKGAAVRLDSSANVIVAGTEKNTTKDIFVVKYASITGDEFWTVPPGSEYQVYDGGGSDEARDLWVDSAGAVYVTGYTIAGLIDMDIYTAKFTDGGTAAVTKVWEEVFNDSGANDDDPRAIAVDENGDVYVTGICYDKVAEKNDFLTIKYKKGTGSLIWSKTYDGASNLHDETFGIGFSSSTPGDVIVGGHTQAAATGYDYYAVKYDYGQLDRPTNLTASFNAIDKIDLAWNDNSSNEFKFQLQRCAAVAGSDCPGADYAPVILLNADTTNHQDTGLNKDTQYYYRIRACISPCVTEPDDFSDFSNDAYAVTTDVSYSGPADTYTYDHAGYSDIINAIDTLSVSAGLHPVVTGFIMTSPTNKDYYTIMLDRANLTETWSKQYDDVNTYDNDATSITVDSDDNVIVSGWSKLYSLIVPPPPGGYSNDFYTIRYDSAGNEYWGDVNNPGIVFDGSSVTTFSDDNAVQVVTETADPEDNIIIAGYGDESGTQDIYLIKYDPDGNLLWGPVIYDRGGSDFPSAMALDTSGDIFVTGRSKNGTDYDYVTAKYRGSDGQLMWTAASIYNGGNGDDKAWAIAVDSAGDVYVTGESMNAAGNKDFYTIKYLGGVGPGNGGSVEWEKRLDSLAGDDDVAISIAVDPVDGDVVVAGTIVTTNDDNDFFVTRYRSTDGAFVWTPEWRILDRPGTNDEVKTMGMDLSGNVHVTGDSTLTDPDDELTVLDVDLISVLYDHEGSFVSGTIYQTAAESVHEHASVIAVNTYGEAYVGGETSASGSADYLVVKIEGDQLQVPIPLTAVEHYKTVDLTWVDNSEDEVNYVLQRQDSACPILDPDTADEEWIRPADSTSYTDDGVPAGSGLTPDTDYCYRIRTWKSVTEYSRWIEISVHTVALPAPEDLTTTTLNTTGIYLTWTDTATSEDKFNIERCIAGPNCPGTLATNNFAPLGTAPAVPGIGSTGSYRDTTACENTTYYYRVNAEKDGATPYWTSDWVENSSTQVYEPKMGQTSAKAVPTGLDATEVSEVQLDIFWTDNTIDENGFYIWRCEVGTDCPPDKADEIDTVGLELDSSVKLLLHMDDGWDGTVNKVRDSSAGSNDGIEYNGAANASAAPRAGLAGSFDGIDDYLEWPTDSFLPGGSNLKMTVEFWFRHNPLAAAGTIIEQWDSADNNDKSWDVQATTAGKINFRINDKGSGSEYTCSGSTGVYDDGNWHHFAGVFDDAADNMDTYIDGAIHCDGSTSYNLGPDNASSHFHIGAKKNGTSYSTFYKGEIDNVVIYDRALTQSEAVDRFNGIERYSDLTSSLVPDTTYRYRVAAYKPVDASCSLPGNEWTAESPDSLNDRTTSLYPPDNMVAEPTNTTRIDLKWDDNTVSETGFKIQKRCAIGVGCPTAFADLVTVGPNVHKYTDTEVCTDIGSDRTYEYQVQAVKTAAAGWPTTFAVSNQPTIAAVLEPVSLSLVAGTTTESQVELQWTDRTADETGFVLERCIGNLAACPAGAGFPIQDPPGAFTIGIDPSDQALYLSMDEPFWDSTSGEVIDESSSGAPFYHGTANNGADTMAGKFGRAGSFDGTNDYVSTSLNIPQTSAITMEAWVNTTVSSNNAYRHIISTDNGGMDWSIMRYNNDFRVTDGQNYLVSSFDIRTNGEWDHIAAVFDPASGLKFYYNGTEQLLTTTVYTDSSPGNITIGGRSSPQSGRYFNGGIDNVAIFTRALTKEEILFRYKQGVNSLRTYMDDAGLADNQTYTYRVKAYKNAPDPLSTCTANRWDSSYSSLLEVGTDAPLPPDGLTVNALSSTDVEIKWTDHTTSEESFEVQRCAADVNCPGTDFAKIGDEADNGAGVMGQVVFLDDKACYSTTYWYQVNAWKSVETGPPLIPAWATAFSVPSASDTTDGKTDPDTPAAVTITETQIDLTWKDRTADETGFKIERCLHNPPGVDCTAPNTGDFVEQVPPLYTLDSVMTLHMDEAAGTWNGTADEVQDASGNGNHGYRSGGAQVVTGGKYVNAGTFDGSGDYIRVPHDDSINPTDAITVEAWAKRDGADTWNGSWNFVSKRNAYLLGGLSGSKEIRFYIYDGGWRYKSAAPTFDIKEWHHYAGTYDGANIRLYIDGVEQGSPTSWAGTINADTGELNIGRDDGQNSYHNGGLDDVVIYDRALTAAEILQRYDHGTQNYDPAFLTDFTTRHYSDTGLLIDNIYYYRIYAYKDKTCDNCCNAGVDDNSWTTGYISVNQDTQPPAPGNLRITYKGTTELSLAWDDNTSGETGFEVQRCEGTAAECDDVPPGEFELSAAFWSKYIDTQDLEAYTDDEVCENTTYYYRVRSKNTGGSPWNSAWSSIITDSTNPKIAPAALTADQVSDIEIALAWNESIPDETGFIIRRCQGSGLSCDEPGEFTRINTLGANITNYYDKGLAANTEYSYWVSSFKTAVEPACNWESSRVSAVQTTDSLPAAGDIGLQAAAANTTEISLSWNDTVRSETGYAIEKCTGSCSPATVIDSAAPDVTSYSDANNVCNATEYNYRIMVGNEGLSNHEGACWTRSKTLTVTNFQMDYPTQLTVTYDSDMKSDFSDIRFYDSYVNAELPYWISAKTDGVSADVYVRTFSHDEDPAAPGTPTIIMYYGNASAESASDALRTYDLYDLSRSDINNAFSRQGQVLSISSNGEWDDYHVYNPSIIKESSTSYKMWFTGNNGVKNRIGYATSTNGTSWSKYSTNPVLGAGAATTWDDYHAGHASVLPDSDGTYKMWYSGHDGTNWRIGYATSSDGINWTKYPGNNCGQSGNGCVLNYNTTGGTWDDNGAAYPEVIRDRDGTYKMWYSGHDGSRWRIGYATSSDGISWTKYPGNNCGQTGDGCVLNYNTTNGTWDDSHVAGAAVIRDSGDSKYKMWYSGHDGTRWRIGFAESVDGINWNKYSSYVFSVGSGGQWDDYHVGFPAVMRDIDNGYYKMWYSGHDGTRWRTGYAAVRPAKPTASPAPSAALGTEVVVTGGIGGPAAGCTATFSNTWTVYSDPVSVTTPAPVTPVLTLSVIDDSRIDLNWTETPANTDETRYEVERCEAGTGCTLTLPAEGIVGADVMTYPDSGLLSGTQYEYLVRAHKDASCSWDAESNQVTARTAPRAPILTSVLPLNSLVMEIKWTDQSGGSAPEEDGFEVWRAIWGGTFVRIDTAGPSAGTGSTITYNDTQGLEPQTIYTYKVRSFRGSDDSDFSNKLSNSTPYYTTGDSICSP